MSNAAWTPERIERELAICEAATPGEWQVEPTIRIGDRSYGPPNVRPVDPDQHMLISGSGGARSYTRDVVRFDFSDDDDRNAAFIAAAKTGYPSALNEILRLRARLELDSFTDGAGDPVSNADGSLDDHDGIACRDATIKLRDAEIERLQVENRTLRNHGITSAEEIDRLRARVAELEGEVRAANLSRSNVADDYLARAQRFEAPLRECARDAEALAAACADQYGSDDADFSDDESVCVGETSPITFGLIRRAQASIAKIRAELGDGA